MSTRLIIRPTGILDAPLLAALHAICFDQPWDQHWTGKSFTEVLSMPGAMGRIAAASDEPVGFALARLAADEAELLLLGTHPAWRRAGHGRALLVDVLQSLAAAGARRVYLEVAAPNFAAREFYRAAGFADVGMRPRYYRAAPPADQAADALVLSRALVASDLPIE